MTGTNHYMAVPHIPCGDSQLLLVLYTIYMTQDRPTG